MIKELTELISMLPSVKKLAGGIMCDYSDNDKTGICIRPRPGTEIPEKYLDRTEKRSRFYTLELHFKYTGVTVESIENQSLCEKIEQELVSAKVPEISEGKITEIALSGRKRVAEEVSVGSGVLYIDFTVLYIAENRRDCHGRYSVFE